MDAKRMTLIAAEVIGFFDERLDHEFDDAARAAILEIAAKAYTAKITRESILASLHQILNKRT